MTVGVIVKNDAKFLLAALQLQRHAQLKSAALDHGLGVIRRRGGKPGARPALRPSR